ncbi:MAG: 3-dehydroquinate synthase [Nitrospirae bacterium]|nr:3-dehydroquinate synthase [Nitrospirota bacterium]
MAGSGNNFILVGSTGSGKTTIGRRLAEQLRLKFVDTDGLIEQAAGRSIVEIFRAGGEPRFRALERRVIGRAVKEAAQVISTGGGSVLDPINRARLKRAGLTIWLKARPDVAAARLDRATDRPLLGQGDRSQAITTLLREREAHYREALLHVDTSDRTTDEVVAGIVRRLRPASTSVPVTAGQNKYDVEIGWETLPRVGERLAALGRSGRVGVITNPRVAALYAGSVTRSLRAAGFQSFLITIPDGERYKTLRSASRVYDELVGRRFERGDTILALGGGVIGDLVGFVAATYLRGVAYLQVPTTVVAQVDSSIGGKTGVDHPLGKNLVGAFHHPILVYSDVSTLSTLPRRELVAGLAEVVKYGVIADASFFAFVEDHADAILGGVPDVLTEVVRRSVVIKADIVKQDEREAGLRKILNYGHTVGHVVETCTGYSKYRHGEAVAIGMDFAARLAQDLGMCDGQLVRRQRGLLERLGLPWVLPPIRPSSAIRSMSLDKKVRQGRIHFVLPQGLGRVNVEPVASERILATWKRAAVAKEGRNGILIDRRRVGALSG